MTTTALSEVLARMTSDANKAAEDGKPLGAQLIFGYVSKIESALASAEPVATVCDLRYFYDGVVKWTGDQLPAGTKLYTRAQPAAKVEAPSATEWNVEAIYEAFKTWPDDIRRKLSFHDLRRMNGWVPPKPTPASVPDGWLPIESAPKSIVDGQRVGGIYLLGYVPDADVADPAACIDIIWWEPLLPNNRGSRGKWCASKFGDDCEVVPSHWQPLPTPPTNPSELAP